MSSRSRQRVQMFFYTSKSISHTACTAAQKMGTATMRGVDQCAFEPIAQDQPLDRFSGRPGSISCFLRHCAEVPLPTSPSWSRCRLSTFFANASSKSSKDYACAFVRPSIRRACKYTGVALRYPNFCRLKGIPFVSLNVKIVWWISSPFVLPPLSVTTNIAIFYRKGFFTSDLE